MIHLSIPFTYEKRKLSYLCMSIDPKQYKPVLSEIYNDKFIGEVTNRFEKQIKFFDDYQSYLKSLRRATSNSRDPSELRRSFSRARIDLLKIVDSHFSAFEATLLDDDFKDYLNGLDGFINALKRRVTQPQVQERFKVQIDDSVHIRIGKFQKRFFYAISKWPEIIANGFRHLFRKQKKELRPWLHTIYLQRLARFYLKEELLRRSSLQMQDFYRGITSTSKALWRLDETLDDKLGGQLPYDRVLEKIRQLNSDLEQFHHTFIGSCHMLFDEVFLEFEQAFYKAGTIELTNNRFNPRNLKKKHDRSVRKYLRLSKGWNNTLRLMSDDWEIDLELYSIIHAAQGQLQKCSESLKNRVKSGVNPGLDRLSLVIQEYVNKVEICKPGKLKNVLTTIHKDFRLGLLARPAKETADIVLSQDLPSLINEVEAVIDRGINSIGSKRAVVSGSEYDGPVRSSAISYVSPFELINFESWPQFKKAAREVKIETTGHINNIINTFQSLNQIAEFNIESSLALYDDPSESDPKEIALEGLARTAEKINDIQRELNGFQKLVDEALQEAVDEFNQSLIKFTNNENIFDIKVRIARAKAVERSKNLKDHIFTQVKNAIPTVVRFSSVKYRKGYDWVKETFKRYGINAEQEIISTELVDFLAETENSINKLPFVYQRLFRSQALEDLSFYESRGTEITELNRAYNNWTKNRFAPAIVIGEKGSGLTTLLHFAIEEIGSSKPVIHIHLKERILVPDDIATFFSSQLKTKFKNLAELAKYLNEGPKRIIVIENLQRMYLRKVGGFDCLMELLQLITITSRNVFWMAGCTLYAWNYLEKTMKLSEHFGYVVKLEDFNSEQIVSVISKRHQVSGYNVEFEPTVLNVSSKKFKNLDSKSQQKLLRKQYFDDLNKIAKSNISLALLYWLRSTNVISGSTISISGLRDIDFSFLNSYAQDKLFGLTQLVIHDGLSEKDFMEVSGKSSSGSRNVLYPLLDDGILIEQNGVFGINPLLYRQVVNLLKVKNIIH